MDDTGRQAGRQVYVCTDDERRFLAEASLPDVLRRHIVGPWDLEPLVRAGEAAGVAIDSRAATQDVAQMLQRIRASGIVIPLIVVVHGTRRSRVLRPPGRTLPCGAARHT